MLELYRALTILGAPLILLHLKQREARGLEDPTRQNERRGASDKPRPPGPLIWCHAASVGEAISVFPLIERLTTERPHIHILITTGTVTSAKLCAERLPERAFHQYMPVDRPAWVGRFLNHWKPNAVLWIESELWPNALGEIRRQNIPAALVNARMSKRSFRRWQRFSREANEVMQSFHTCLVPDADEARRLKALHARQIRVTGNLKDAAPALTADEEELIRIQRMIEKRPIWLAASTHSDEEAIAAEAHSTLKAEFPTLLTIIAPRHPTRGKKIEKLLKKEGLKVVRRSLNQIIAADTDIYIADTLGEMGLLYRLATIVFVGGSLVPHGGQNLREPARLHSAILHGPHIANFNAVAEHLTAGGGAREVADKRALTKNLRILLNNPSNAKSMADAAFLAVNESEKILDDVIEALSPVLNALDGDNHAST